MILLTWGWAWAQDEPPEPTEEQPVLEVIVHRERDTWRTVERAPQLADPSPETGVYTLTQRDLDATPGAIGDVARAVHTLPGVVSDGDLLAGFHVRGGEQQEVVFLLDRVPLDNPFHLAGFNSLFNPDLVRQIRFYAGAAPASVPSATSAVVEVSTWDGTSPDCDEQPGCGGIDGSVELGVTGARFALFGALDRPGHVTFALAARRSWVEAYVAVLKGLDVVDSATVAPEFSELSARIAWHPGGHHRLMLTALRAGDSIGLVDSEDPADVEFDGALDLSSSLTLFSLDHRFQSPGLELQTTLASTRDRSSSNRELERDTLRHATVLKRLYARTDLTLPFTPNATVKAGLDLSRFSLTADGELQDTRSFPTWAQGGIGAYGFQVVQVDPVLDPWAEASVYLQTQLGAPFGAGEPIAPGVPIVPGIKVDAGIRLTYTGLSNELLPSPRAGISIPLPTGTVPKIRVGLYQRTLRDPFQRDPDFGNPALTAERARHLVLGLDQGLPLPGGHGALVRIEAYEIASYDLVVNADTASAPPFTNEGTGRTRGLDTMLAAQADRWSVRLAYGLLFARRTNPRNTRWPKTIPPPQDQRHTLSVSADLEAGPWQFLTRYAFHSGRPTSEVSVLSEQYESVQLSCLNCSRIGATHAVDLRTEWHHRFRHHRLTVSVELLNVGNVRSVYLPVHDVVDGEVRTSSLNHLPMRPLFAVRSDF